MEGNQYTVTVGHVTQAGTYCSKCGRSMDFANPSTFWYTNDGIMCGTCHETVDYQTNVETGLRAEIEALKLRIDELEEQVRKISFQGFKDGLWR